MIGLVRLKGTRCDISLYGVLLIALSLSLTRLPGRKLSLQKFSNDNLVATFPAIHYERGESNERPEAPDVATLSFVPIAVHLTLHKQQQVTLLFRTPRSIPLVRADNPRDLPDTQFNVLQLRT